MTSPRLRVLLLVLILAGFFLRAHLLGYQELRGDEGFSSHLVRKGASHALQRLVTSGEPSMPLHVLVLAASIDLWGNSEFGLRYASVLGGLMCVPLVFVLGRRLYGPEAGAWAAVLMAANPFMVWYAQDARNMYVFMTLFSLLASAFLWRATEAGTASRRDWAGYVLAAALGVYSHYYALLPLAAHAIWVALFRRARWREYVIAAAGAAALVLPWAAVHVPSILAYGPTGGGDPVPVAELLGRVARAFAAGDFLGVPAWAALAFWGMVIALGLGTARVRGTAGRAWLLLAVLVPVAVSIALAQRRTLFNEGYALAALPPLLALAGGALAWKPGMRAAGILLAVLALLAVYRYETDPQYSRTVGWRALRDMVALGATAQDVVVANYPDPTLDYYIRGPAQTLILPASPEADPGSIVQALDPVRARDGRVWFLPSGWDSRRLVASYLDESWLMVVDAWAGAQHVLVYATPERVRADMVPVGVDFGDTARLLGYYAVPRVTAGGTLRVVLVWEALGATTADYTVFTHLLSADGMPLAGHDAPPAGGTRPTTAWRRGEVVLDSHALAVPREAAPGEYVLQAGLYDPVAGTRLSLSDGGDAVQLVTVHVK